MSEKWVPSPEFADRYEVSNMGRVRSVNREYTDRVGRRTSKPGAILAQNASRGGYLQVRFKVDGVSKKKSVHRLVMAAFVGPCPAGMEVCHNNGERTDNRLSNLRYDSHSENMYDRRRHGTDHEVNKTHCPRGHLLESPNLVAHLSRRGVRGCLSCCRARSYLQKHPAMKQDLQAVSDQYYAAIIAEK